MKKNILLVMGLILMLPLYVKADEWGWSYEPEYGATIGEVLSIIGSGNDSYRKNGSIIYDTEKLEFQAIHSIDEDIEVSVDGNIINYSSTFADDDHFYIYIEFLVLEDDSEDYEIYIYGDDYEDKIVVPNSYSSSFNLPTASIYSADATIGSQLTYSIAGHAYYSTSGTNSDLDGEISYDSNQLELLDIYIGYSWSCYNDDNMDPKLPEFKIISNNAGSIKYKIIPKEYASEDIAVCAKFKVKDVPDSENLKIKFIPDDKEVLWDDKGYLELEIDTLEKGNDTIKEVSKGNKNDNFILYASIITLVLINIVLVVLLMVKKAKNNYSN